MQKVGNINPFETTKDIKYKSSQIHARLVCFGNIVAEYCAFKTKCVLRVLTLILKYGKSDISTANCIAPMGLCSTTCYTV